MNVAVTRPYNADFDKLKLCQKQEAWKACNLLVTTFSKRLNQNNTIRVVTLHKMLRIFWFNLFEKVVAKHLAAGNPLEP
jgi:hypothetical protein